jgi:hypothetical protein
MDRPKLPQPEPIPLPELRETRFLLGGARLKIIEVPADMLRDPELTLQGGPEAFSHNYNGFLLDVLETPLHAPVEINDSAEIGELPEGSANVPFTLDGLPLDTGRYAQLNIPEGHRITAHNIKQGTTGATEFSGQANWLRIASGSGHVALDGANIIEADISTFDGNISVHNVTSVSEVMLTSNQGNIKITDSAAPLWEVQTMGRVTTENVQGQVNER